MTPQRFAHALGEDAAATERDHSTSCLVLQQPAYELLLARTEGLLTGELKLTRERVAELLLEQRVAVQRPHAELRGELRRNGRLARPHEADQDECHPMRCS